ncbi:hypothetical protein BDY21DRAFT_57405 [Lineolata rhizophorae]|uniref:DUF7924 domain-containing protein n=1 Tax=Lineolata rhizophorae TaxID=578093 RepID=A0A6A6NWU7_9PEZI|nr:hypothetical protein BDY21DRAFT_57405 [Lineolata rhizophorae]
MASPPLHHHLQQNRYRCISPRCAMKRSCRYLSDLPTPPDSKRLHTDGSSPETNERLHTGEENAALRQTCSASAENSKYEFITRWREESAVVMDHSNSSPGRKFAAFAPCPSPMESPGQAAQSVLTSVTPAHSSTNQSKSSAKRPSPPLFRGMLHAVGIGIVLRGLPDTHKAEVDRILGRDGQRGHISDADRAAADIWRNRVIEILGGTFIESDLVNALMVMLLSLSPMSRLACSNCNEWRKDATTSGPGKGPRESSADFNLATRVEDTYIPTPIEGPRPDIAVGLSFKKAVRPVLGRVKASVLPTLQEKNVLVGEPTFQARDLYFPFLVAEVKTGATSGSLFEAQNQAAGDATRAANIFQSVRARAIEAGWQDNGRPFLAPPFIFALTVEDSVVELWVHYFDAQERFFFFTKLGTWDAVDENSYRQLVGMLSRILLWGESTVQPLALGQLKFALQLVDPEL